MARSNDEMERVMAAASTTPIAAKILEQIFEITGAVELHRLYTHVIPETDGISEAEKEALREAVNLRFAALNASAMWPPAKPPRTSR